MNPITTDLLIKSRLEYSKYVNAGNIAVSVQPVLDKKILGYNWQKLVEATRVLPVPPVGFALNNFTNFTKFFAEHLISVPEDIKKSLKLILEKGWFVNFESIDLPTLIELSSYDAEKLNNWFVDYYHSNMEAANSICKIFNNRAHLLRMGFDAYKQEQYALAIPLFLAQADGICKEYFGDYFFTTARNYKSSNNEIKPPSTVSYMIKIKEDEFAKAMLTPLAVKSPINYSSRSRLSESKELNRHLVMHGESLDYGTKINCLKAISIIFYLASVPPICDLNSSNVE